MVAEGLAVAGRAGRSLTRGAALKWAPAGVLNGAFRRLREGGDKVFNYILINLSFGQASCGGTGGGLGRAAPRRTTGRPPLEPMCAAPKNVKYESFTSTLDLYRQLVRQSGQFVNRLMILSFGDEWRGTDSSPRPAFHYCLYCLAAQGSNCPSRLPY